MAKTNIKVIETTSARTFALELNDAVNNNFLILSTHCDSCNYKAILATPNSIFNPKHTVTISNNHSWINCGK